MTFATITVSLFLAGFLGLVIPGAAMFQYREYKRRNARMPLATSLENLQELLKEKREEFASLEEVLKDLAQQKVLRDMAVAEKEECLARKLQAENDLRTLEPRLMELERVNQELAAKQEAMATLSQQLAHDQAQLEEMRSEIRQLPREREQLEQDIAEAKNNLGALDDRISQAQARSDYLRAELAELEPKKNSILQELDFRKKELEEVFNKAHSEQQRLQELRTEVSGLEALKASLEGYIAKVESDLTEAKKTLWLLGEKLSQEETKLNAIRAELAKLEPKKNSIVQELDFRKKELNEVSNQLKSEHQRLLELKAEVSGLEALKKSLEGYVIKAGQIQEEQTDKALEDLHRPAACLDGWEKTNNKVSEYAALEHLHNHLENLNLHYSFRVLKSFHTNLKISHISPMVALAGISGTGKSELPRRYAEAMGIHFLQVAVQPRWDSPQDLFGFYNYLEQRYKATELARAMVRLDRWNWPNISKGYEDKMLLVLLDEMNLARVEYYFSEFLSRLEGRKSVNPEDTMSRSPVEIELDIGRRKGELGTMRVFPAENVLFVGTMNEDESTQSMSDKVIDRSPVIRFARPKKLIPQPPDSSGMPVSYYLSFQKWREWRSDITALSHDIRHNLDGWINRLNKALEGLGRPFGHRLNQAILAYVANHPDMAEDPGIGAARRAFSDQLEQRIFPKLRGLEMDEPANEKFSKAILDLVKDDLQDSELADAFEKSKEKILFAWIGVQRDEDK